MNLHYLHENDFLFTKEDNNMRILAPHQMVVNLALDVKYKFKNNTPERKKALEKLNKQPIDWWFDDVTDVVAKTPNGLFVNVRRCKAGIKIKYQGESIARKDLMIYWNSDGFTCSTSIKTGGDLTGFDIEEIVDFTPVNTDKNEKPKTFPVVEHSHTIPTLALEQVDQIQRCINMLDKALSKPTTSQ